MNPILPFQYCIPDVEAHVFGGRCYLYGSCDLPGDRDYCSWNYHVFSADLRDLSRWTDHGVAFSTGTPSGAGWTRARLYAPDAAQKGGVYYLYFCTADGCEGVAVSGRPEGPFTDAVQLFYPPSVRGGQALSNIDPAVFVDDDGSAYYYWGQFQLQAARLTPDMRHLDGSTYNPCLISEATHFFHEGASMRKFGGRYYLLFCSLASGRANTLDYAIGDSPLGPFAYCGSLVNNAGCDPESWNNHGSVQMLNGQLYLFYHRSSNNSRCSRRVCVERLSFSDDGRILPVRMTSLGFDEVPAADSSFAAHTLSERSGKCYLRQEDSGMVLCSIHGGDTALWRYMRFDGRENAARLCLRVRAPGCVTVRRTGEGIRTQNTAALSPGGGWQQVRLPVQRAAGAAEVELCFEAAARTGEFCDLQSISFERKG